ncbi:MAG: RNA polymerase sigma factor [Thermoguttaceae bacterium]
MTFERESDLEKLLTCVAQGDRDASTELLERYREPLLRMVCEWLEQESSPRIDPNELVTRTMNTAMERLTDNPAVRSEPISTWLRALAREQLCQLRQAHRTDSEKTPAGPGEPRFLSEPAAQRLAVELMSDNADAMGRLLKKALRRRLASVLARLDRFDRELLILRHVEGLSMPECAVVLGISEEAVKVRYVEVLGRLRGLLRSRKDA